MARTLSRQLANLGLTLPPAPTPVGSYSAAVVDGEWGWVSGQIVTEGGRALLPGTVGAEVGIAPAQELARRAALQALAALAAAVGSVDRLERVVRVGVFVASASGFDRQHEVANGATDLFAELFPDQPRPARVAVGVAGLPLGAPVEVELLARIRSG